jgi:hypothetical protein
MNCEPDVGAASSGPRRDDLIGIWTQIAEVSLEWAL